MLQTIGRGQEVGTDLPRLFCRQVLALRHVAVDRRRHEDHAAVDQVLVLDDAHLSDVDRVRANQRSVVE